MRNLDNLLGKMQKKITGQIFYTFLQLRGFQKNNIKTSTEVAQF